MVTPPLTKASIKGIRYHPIYFYCVQKGYILSYNKLKIQVQSKGCLFVVQVQRFPISSLPTTTCSFVEQILKSVPLFWRFCNNMKEASGQQINQDKTQHFFNSNTDPQMQENIKNL